MFKSFERPSKETMDILFGTVREEKNPPEPPKALFKPEPSREDANPPMLGENKMGTKYYREKTPSSKELREKLKQKAEENERNVAENNMPLKDKLQERTEAGKEITQEQIEEIKEYLIAEMNEAADKGMLHVEIRTIYLSIIKGYSEKLIDAAIDWLNREGIKAYVYTEEDHSTPMVSHKPKTSLYISWECE